MASEKGIEAKNKEAVQASFHAWHEGSGSPFDLLIPEAKWTIVGNATVSKTYNGSQEFLELVVDPFNARMQRRLRIIEVGCEDRNGDCHLRQHR